MLLALKINCTPNSDCYSPSIFVFFLFCCHFKTSYPKTVKNWEYWWNLKTDHVKHKPALSRNKVKKNKKSNKNFTCIQLFLPPGLKMKFNVTLCAPPPVLIIEPHQLTSGFPSSFFLLCCLNTFLLVIANDGPTCKLLCKASISSHNFVLVVTKNKWSAMKGSWWFLHCILCEGVPLHANLITNMLDFSELLRLNLKRIEVVMVKEI